MTGEAIDFPNERHEDRTPAMVRKPFSAAEFANRPMKRRQFLVEDMFPIGQVTTVDGEGGGGKSTLMMQCGAAAVTGRAWLGQAVATGPVLYLSAEDDEDEIHRRLHNIVVHYGVGMEDIADFHIWSLADEDPALVTACVKGDSIETTPLWTELQAQVEQIRPVVLVLDSRADVFAGNEISRNQARGFVGLLRRLAIRHNMAVVLLAHPSLSGISSGSGSSGSTHWRNAVRAALYLSLPDDDGSRSNPDLRVLTLKKANYSAPGMSMTIRWSAGAFVLDEEHGGRRNCADEVAAVDAAFLRLLAKLCAQQRDVSDKPGANYAPAIFAKEAGANGIKARAFATAMIRLFDSGTVRVELAGPPSRQRRRLVPV